MTVTVKRKVQNGDISDEHADDPRQSPMSTLTLPDCANSSEKRHQQRTRRRPQTKSDVEVDKYDWAKSSDKWHQQRTRRRPQSKSHVEVDKWLSEKFKLMTPSSIIMKTVKYLMKRHKCSPSKVLDSGLTYNYNVHKLSLVNGDIEQS